jgi:hypothetical protein
MSYVGISVREAMEKINSKNGGWFLPYIQRQYVWGARYESEEYVCLLLDSLLERYPIGGLVLWETESKIPYRAFLDDYEPGKFAKLVEEGRHSAHKFLVYDGQQRLQTLHSVLYHTFNDRVLYFDLLANAEKSDSDETGFLFRDVGSAPEPRYLKMTELVSKRCDAREKIDLEMRLLDGLRSEPGFDTERETLVRTNLAKLWDIFVDTNVKSLAYFPTKAKSETLVNEVFRRLNIGGIALTQNELVLGKIKQNDPTYEENLWALSEAIKAKSQIEFSSAQSLQFFYLLEKGTIKVDESRFNNEDAKNLLKAFADRDALVELFEGYLWGLFKINHASIIPLWPPILPLAAYLTSLKRANRRWKIKELTEEQVSAMDTYFLSAQFCDWGTQIMVNKFAEFAATAGADGIPLPIVDIRNFAVEKNRSGTIAYKQFLSRRWLALKILTRERVYLFHENKPQIDHIFPINLDGMDEVYKEKVDVLWNLEPMPAGVNNWKRKRHPKEFFNSTDGAKYWDGYDYIPDRQSPIWDNYVEFLKYRETEMRKALKEKYKIELRRDEEAT